ncbi:hypothetical protein JK358_34265 [Nocardia sp. 2]|uniref:Uncharacterized protein n=1 Tax=Nocardia acididurans TaxID=2802282 RepID=A0ABS1MFP7_9NOCA|nr:hypothetical protein [Nocardia acididurans]MBL1079483.1 hypothetical protein [Nocardia acididurans]
MSGRTVALGVDQIRRAQLQVAGRAADHGECRELLAMLGLLGSPETAQARQVLVCRGCGRRMVPNATPGRVPEGWARQQTGSQCRGCYLRAKPTPAPAHPIPVPAVTVEPMVSRPRRRNRNRPQDIEFQVRVAELRAVQCRSWGEIAGELGCTARTARSAYALVEVARS